METINITEDQRARLCGELARLFFEFKKDKRIRCVYYAPYNGTLDIEGAMLLVTAVVDYSDAEAIDAKFEECNSMYQQSKALESFGLRLFMDIAPVPSYSPTDIKPIETEHRNDLFNAVILYDADGKYTQWKTQMDSAGVGYQFENLAAIEPPIEEELEKAIEDARDERDTKAVKEFTRSRLFQEFKDI